MAIFPGCEPSHPDASYTGLLSDSQQLFECFTAGGKELRTVIERGSASRCLQTPRRHAPADAPGFVNNVDVFQFEAQFEQASSGGQSGDARANYQGFHWGMRKCRSSAILPDR
jgi:hypothetical protein